jgi:hypothetical protein
VRLHLFDGAVVESLFVVAASGPGLFAMDGSGAAF